MSDFLGMMIKSWFTTLGYGGIILAMAIESCLLPLPSEIIMPVAGTFIGTGVGVANFSLVGAALAGAIGCVLGSGIAYGIGVIGGRPFIMHYGKYLLISRHDFDLADRWFVRYGTPITFFSRLLPIIRTYISLPAGIARMNFFHFLVFTFLGSFPWCLALAYLGQQLGKDFGKQVGSILHGADVVIGGLLIVGVAFYIWRHVRKEREYDRHLQQQH
jgi:membrane protein DedA with SNARE-associated domain